MYKRQPTASASGGYYRFDNLPTFVERNGERYLAGYQLQLCEMPKGYAATKCRIGEDTAKDSDLFADTLHLYENADEVIILAEASSGNDFYDRNVEMCIRDRGIEDVTVTLQSFYYDSDTGKWVAITGGDRDIKTSESGSYVFQNVSSYYEKDGKTYLAGYRLYVDPAKNADLYQKYAITKYKQYPNNRSTENSDLQYTGRCV